MIVNDLKWQTLLLKLKTRHAPIRSGSVFLFFFNAVRSFYFFARQHNFNMMYTSRKHKMLFVSLRHCSQIICSPSHVNKHSLSISTIVLNNLQKQFLSVKDMKSVLRYNFLIRERPKWIKIILRSSIVLCKSSSLLV